MPEPVKTRKPWPRPLTVTLLVVYVIALAFLWVVGSIAAFEEQRVAAGILLTGGLVLLLVGGWAWRWAVAAGFIGGRARGRFA